MQCSHFVFVCIYVYISVTLQLRGRGFCGLIPRLLATWYLSDQKAIDVSMRSYESRNGAGAVQA